MSLVPALWRQSQVDFYEFEVSLIYRANSRIAKATHRNVVSKNQEQNKTKQKKQKQTKERKRKWPTILLACRSEVDPSIRQALNDIHYTAKAKDEDKQVQPFKSTCLINLLKY